MVRGMMLQLAKSIRQAARRAVMVSAALGFLSALPAHAQPDEEKPIGPPRESGLLDTTRGFRGAGVQTLDDLRSMVIEGPKESVDALSRVIEELDRLSIGSEAAIEVVRLIHADSEGLADALRQVYDSRETARPQQRARGGKVAFVPIAQPNAVIVIAPAAEIAEVVAFVSEIDKNAQVGDRQYRIFSLQQATASIVRQKLLEFFSVREDAAGLRVRVEVVADDRTNSLIVYAGPADLEQAATLIDQLDRADSDAVTELRVFPLRYAQASVLADLINQSIGQRSQSAGTGQLGGRTPTGGGQGGGGRGAQNQLGSSAVANALKSTRLRLTSIDADGKAIESGILEDIIVTADTRTNSLVVTAPPTTMNLLQSLIEQLDRGPGPGQTVRVFTLLNSSAEELLNTLQRIFGTTTGGTTGTTTTGARTGGAQGAIAPQTSTGTTTGAFGTTGSSSALGAPASLPVRFTPDYRTNSIIASGSEEDLRRIEEIVMRLDARESKQRETIVYHLKNLTALEAVQSLNEYLQRERLQDQITVISVQQDERTAQDQSQGVVTASDAQAVADRTPLDPQTNSIIVTANPGLLATFLQVVQQIDERPAQVVIQVLIAQIELDNADEFGLEVGFQNDVLFNRSLIVGNQGIGRDSLNPGFGFNSTGPLQSPYGSNSDSTGLQSLTNFGLGRASPLGYGGLIFAASSDNISILLRALKRQRRLDVLSRPQVMTLDNQQASIQIGQRIRVPTGSVTAPQGGTTSSFQREDIGIILAVTPRLSPEGKILMRVAPQISSLQRDSSGAIEGLPVGTNEDNTVIETPIINITQAVTTIAAGNGETVVIGGLITKETVIEERKLPVLGDIPYAEWLFKTRARGVMKRELLIILTPHVVANELDAERIKQEESCRIDWIMSDVEEVHGNIGVVCPPKDEKDKCCDKHKNGGPIMNLPNRAVLPRSLHPHARKHQNGTGANASCPAEGVETLNDPLAPATESMPIEEIPSEIIVPSESSGKAAPPPKIPQAPAPPETKSRIVGIEPVAEKGVKR